MRNMEVFAATDELPMTARDRKDFRELVRYVQAQMTDSTFSNSRWLEESRGIRGLGG